MITSTKFLLFTCKWHALTFDELGVKSRGIATEVNMGTLFQDERVFLVKWVTT